MKNDCMRFTVPTNWDPHLLESLDTTNIGEIYGKLQKDPLGGGRSAALLTPVSKAAVAREIKKIHSCGISFTYLLNSPSLGNVEWTRRGQKQIREFLDWLEAIGVDTITVAIPYLLQLIKKCYPGFGVNVSSFASVDNPIKAAFWEDLGADQITLSPVVNRDFTLLKEIREATGVQLHLIANLLCIYGCPFVHYHGTLAGYSSQTRNRKKSFCLDYCVLSCRNLKLKRPDLLVASRWIRPEDLHYYLDLGIDMIKLVDRGMTTPALTRIVDAYTRRSYCGNLLDLFPYQIDQYRISSAKYFWRKFLYFFRPADVNPIRLKNHLETISRHIPVHLDNRKLEGFLTFFIEGKCSSFRCDECGYCRRIALKALSVPTEESRALQKGYTDFLEDLIDGRMFYINGKKKPRRR